VSVSRTPENGRKNRGENHCHKKKPFFPALRAGGRGCFPGQDGPWPAEKGKNAFPIASFRPGARFAFPCRNEKEKRTNDSSPFLPVVSAEPRTIILLRSRPKQGKGKEKKISLNDLARRNGSAARCPPPYSSKKKEKQRN